MCVDKNNAINILISDTMAMCDYDSECSVKYLTIDEGLSELQ